MFVVINSMMGGKDAVDIFSKEEGATAYIKASDIANPSVEEHDVHGEYKYPNPVYAAHEYLRAKDIHEFTGLYSNYDVAISAVGKHGLALKLVPDSK